MLLLVDLKGKSAAFETFLKKKCKRSCEYKKDTYLCPPKSNEILGFEIKKGVADIGLSDMNYKVL